jgi:glycosyltransferase family protein
MIVLDEYQTIDQLLKYRKGISRYGDGELRLCFGRNAISQPGNEKLSKRLCSILKSDLSNHLVGIPRTANGSMPRDKRVFWGKYTTPKFLQLYRDDKVYGSAFISRPDSAPEIDTGAYYNLVKGIWEGREVLLVQGEGRRFLKAEPNLFSSAISYDVMYAPSYDAFSHYEELLDQITSRISQDTVVVLSLGATATVMAFDLCNMGVQALDLGHMGMFYAHIHPKDRQYDGRDYPKDGPP